MINPVNQRRFELGILTAYSSGLCLLVVNYFQFAGPYTFLAPVISIVSNPIYFGQWIDLVWQVLYSTIIGTGLGTIISFSSQVDYNFHLILIFITLTIINSISSWERLSKVIGSFTCTLSAVLPVISNGSIRPYQIFTFLLALTTIPFGITGICLLFPYPRLAAKTAINLIDKITQHLKRITTHLIHGFDSTLISSDIYTTEAEYLFIQIERDIAALHKLIKYVHNESIYLPYGHLPAALSEYVTQFTILIEEYRGLQRMLPRIPMNITQQTFALYMKDALYEYATVSCTLLDTMNDYIQSLQFKPYHMIIHSIHHNVVYLYHYICVRNYHSPKVSLSSTNIKSSSPAAATVHESINDTAIKSNVNIHMTENSQFHNSNGNNEDTKKDISVTKDAHMNHTTSTVNNDSKNHQSSTATTASAAMNYVHLYQDRYYYEKKYEDLLPQLDQAKSHIVDKFRLVRSTYVIALRTHSCKQQHHETHTLNKNHTINDMNIQVNHEGSANISNTYQNTPARHSVLEESKRQSYFASKYREWIINDIDEDILQHIVEENYHLLTRNLNPRGAYLGRLFGIHHKFHRLHSLFTSTTKPHSYIKFMYTFIILGIWKYLIGILPEALKVCKAVSFFVHYYNHHSNVIQYLFTCCNHTSNATTNYTESSTKLKEDMKLQWKVLFPYIQPMKIAGAITLTSIFIILPPFRNTTFTHNAIWAVAAITFIRQDNTSSSFLTCYQRLEGTLIGALFAYAIFEGLQCSRNSILCTNTYKFPLLIVWIGLCAAFKEGPRHGYSAVVAAFTPNIILLLPTNIDSEIAWRRVMLTFIGVAIYLCIDILIFPNRTDMIMKKSLLLSINETVTSLTHVIHSVGNLLHYCYDSSKKDSQSNLHSTCATSENDHLYSSSLITAAITKPQLASTNIATLSSSSSSSSLPSPLMNHSDIHVHNTNHHHHQPVRKIDGNVQYDGSEYIIPAHLSVTSEYPIALHDISIPTTTTLSRQSSHTYTQSPHHQLLSNTSSTPSTPKSDAINTLEIHDHYTIQINDIRDTMNLSLLEQDISGSSSKYPAVSRSTSTDTPRSLHSPPSNPRTYTITSEGYIDLHQLIQVSHDHMEHAEKALQLIHKHVTMLDSALALADHEPDVFFSRPFPIHSYMHLTETIRIVARSIYSLLSSAHALSGALADMIEQHEHIRIYMTNFKYISDQIFQVALLSITAMTLASNSLYQLFEEQKYDIDISALISIRTVTEKTMDHIEQYFSHIHMRQEEMEYTNPLFVITWQNVFESMIYLMRNLAELGKAILIVRETEHL